MKQVKRWRYYCGYCKKSGGSKWHMEKHEKSCTKNPDRECGFCTIQGGSGTSDKRILMRIVKAGASVLEKLSGMEDWCSSTFDIQNDRIIKMLVKHSGGCPACILSALRLSGENAMLISFDYKKTKDQFWSDNPRDEPDYSDYC